MHFNEAETYPEAFKTVLNEARCKSQWELPFHSFTVLVRFTEADTREVGMISILLSGNVHALIFK